MYYGTGSRNTACRKSGLATQIVDYLGEYLGPLLEKGEAALIKGGEKALEGAAIKTVQTIWQKLGGLITGRKEAKNAAEKLVSQPNDKAAKEQFTKELVTILEFANNLLPELKEIMQHAGDGSHNTVHAVDSAVAIGSGSTAANNKSTVITGNLNGNLTVNN